jgi:Right handed beta helix region
VLAKPSSWLRGRVLSLIPLALALLCVAPQQLFSSTYYVQCRSGNDRNSGTSAASPWKTIGRANRMVFRPGDSILLARESVCYGALRPQGSGTADAIITLSAYGTGRLPLIRAGRHQAAIELKDQSYWQISHVETTGGDPYGIWITGDQPNAVMRHIYLSQVVVHDVTGTPTRKDSGLIVFHPQAKGERFEDVLVDGATAYNTTQWAGIYIDGARFEGPAGPKGQNITVRYSTVHDVGGDGIVIFVVKHALIENSLAYRIGLAKVTRVGTPSAIWNWDCDHAVVQYNEAYDTHTPGNLHDAGAYDSDYFNHDLTIQYNYAHDTDGYCVAVFGADGKDTNVNTVIRYNVCSNDGRMPSLAYQGDFFLSTWDGGSIRHALIYNNTSYWNPAKPAAALLAKAEFDPAEADGFFNNIIYASVPGMEDYEPAAADVFKMNHNIFWNIATGTPQWEEKGTLFASLAAWQHATGQDLHSQYANPLMAEPSFHSVSRPALQFTLLPGSPAQGQGLRIANMGKQDFFGHPLPLAGPVDIGAGQSETPASSLMGTGEQAPQFNLQAARGGRLSLRRLLRNHRAVLLSFVSANSLLHSTLRPSPSDSQIVVLKSMNQQYSAVGMVVAIVGAPEARSSGIASRRQLLNSSFDWHLGQVPLLCDYAGLAARRYSVVHLPTTFLIGRNGEILRRWNRYVAPAPLSFALQRTAGPFHH